MSAEIVFMLEPDTGRVTVESSQASAVVVNEIKRDLGQATTLNCARPQSSDKSDTTETLQKVLIGKEAFDDNEIIYLFRLYHQSTVDGPGRRSAIQLAGCSIRCPGCYVPETHERINGRPTLIDEIVAEIAKRSEPVRFSTLCFIRTRFRQSAIARMIDKREPLPSIGMQMRKANLTDEFQE